MSTTVSTGGRQDELLFKAAQQPNDMFKKAPTGDLFTKAGQADGMFKKGPATDLFKGAPQQSDDLLKTAAPPHDTFKRAPAAQGDPTQTLPTQPTPAQPQPQAQDDGLFVKRDINGSSAKPQARSVLASFKSSTSTTPMSTSAESNSPTATAGHTINDALRIQTPASTTTSAASSVEIGARLPFNDRSTGPGSKQDPQSSQQGRDVNTSPSSSSSATSVSRPDSRAGSGSGSSAASSTRSSDVESTAKDAAAASAAAAAANVATSAPRDLAAPATAASSTGPAGAPPKATKPPMLKSYSEIYLPTRARPYQPATAVLSRPESGVTSPGGASGKTSPGATTPSTAGPAAFDNPLPLRGTPGYYAARADGGPHYSMSTTNLTGLNNTNSSNSSQVGTPSDHPVSLPSSPRRALNLQLPSRLPRQLHEPKTPLYTPAVLRRTRPADCKVFGGPSWFGATSDATAASATTPTAGNYPGSSASTVQGPRSGAVHESEGDGFPWHLSSENDDSTATPLGKPAYSSSQSTLLLNRPDRAVSDSRYMMHHRQDSSSSSSSSPDHSPTRRHWRPDSSRQSCAECQRPFTLFDRRHHCRRCGEIFCAVDSRYTVFLDQEANFDDSGIPSRSCLPCATSYSQYSVHGNSDGAYASLDDSRKPRTPIVGPVKTPNPMTLTNSTINDSTDGHSEPVDGNTNSNAATTKTGSLIPGSVPPDWAWSTF